MLFGQVIDDRPDEKVPCFGCGLMIRLNGSWTDLDGPAYEAYYHHSCAMRAAWVAGVKNAFLTQPLPERPQTLDAFRRWAVPVREDD